MISTSCRTRSKCSAHRPAGERSEAPAGVIGSDLGSGGSRDDRADHDRAMRWIVLLLVGLCAVADARPGGGQSFSSGGGRSYSSGGYHSSGYHPSGGGYHSGDPGGGLDAGALIGILIAGGLVLLIIVALSSATAHAWDSSRVRPEPPPRLDMSPIVSADPEFSRVAFEDFAYQLYAAAQRARNDEAALAKLSPYLTPEVRARLVHREGRVEQVVIGTLRIVAANVDAQTKQSRLVVAYEANLARRDTTLACKE